MLVMLCLVGYINSRGCLLNGFGVHKHERKHEVVGRMQSTERMAHHWSIYVQFPVVLSIIQFSWME